MSDESPWQIFLAPPAEKALSRLSRTDRERLREAIKRLPAGDVVRLRGRGDDYRLRVGDWRVIFTMDPALQMIFIEAVRARGSAYRP